MDPSSVASDDPWIGRTLGTEFRIERQLGSGGFGNVYIAEQLGVQRDVVVKVIRRALTENKDIVQRFKREARIVARISHPNVVQVFTAGETEDGAHYLVMELVRGPTLGELLVTEGRLPQLRAIRIAEQIAGGLAAAHEAGVIHRDLKPANVIVAPATSGGDHIKVLDFGIAKLRGAPDSGETSGLTANGAIVGTPAYMSPEQVSGGDIDGRSDVYTLALMLYEMVTGKHPFEANTPVQFIIQHLNEPITPPSVRTPGLLLDPRLEALLAQCLAKSPADRIDSARDVHIALKRIGDAVEAGTTAPELTPARATRDLPHAAHNNGNRTVAVIIAILLLLGLTISAGVGFAVYNARHPEARAPEASAPDSDPRDEPARRDRTADDRTPTPQPQTAQPRTPQPQIAQPQTPQPRRPVPIPKPPSVPANAAPTPAPPTPAPPTPAAQPARSPALALLPDGPQGAPLPTGSTISMRTEGMIAYRAPHGVGALAPLFYQHYKDFGNVMFNMDDAENPEEPYFSLMLTGAEQGVHMISVIHEGPARSRVTYFVR